MSPTQIKSGVPVNLIDALAAEVEFQVGDGTPFFDTIDSLLSSDFFYEVQWNRFLNEYGAPDGSYNIAVSGKWGRGFADWLRYAHRGVDLMVIVFPGDLRHEKQIPVDDIPYSVRHKKFVMLDNSLYKGRTMRKVAQALAIRDSILIENLVLYDGSLEGIPWTTGVFRYHA